MSDPDIPSGIFADPVRGTRNLVALHEAFIGSGTHFPLDAFARPVNFQLARSPDPDMALTNFLRFCEATVSRTALFNQLLNAPPVLELLFGVFGSSQYFADILVREPGLFGWLVASDALSAPLKSEELHREVERVFRTFKDPGHRLDALKRLHRREVLRIGVQDITGAADLPGVTLQLSLLADAMAGAACALADAQLREKWGAGPSSTFAVIGLGKLGGSELNYSSDIDVLFVYGADGEFSAGPAGAVTHVDYFNRVAERVVQILSEPTAEGYFYRVDIRLRPESGAGLLARSLPDLVRHYESRGELWERQMLIKARPIAGDPALGADFLSRLQPFVYASALPRDPLKAVQAMKARIETDIAGEPDIKLMAGGIRDIEFIVQALQLVNGAARESLRERNTLRALRLLAEERLLASDECDALTQAYIFYRMIEHRLQTMLNVRTHTIPGGEAALSSLGKRVGLRDASELRAVQRKHLECVKSVFDKVFSGAPSDALADLPALIAGGRQDQATDRILARHGFRNTRLAARNLKLLFSDGAGGTHRSRGGRSGERAAVHAAELVRDIVAADNPDLALADLALLVSGDAALTALAKSLSDPRSRGLLVRLCASSPRLCRSLARDPLLLDRSLPNREDALAPKRAHADRVEDPVEYKTACEFSAGIRYLFGGGSVEELCRELTSVADEIVSGALDEEIQAAGLHHAPLAVFALGKYGTREITFDADLDVLFICAASSAAEQSRLDALAGRVVQRLSAVTPRGTLYTVDTRLRPEGRNAPLVSHADGYSAYLWKRASLWERQSLTRLRHVTGDRDLAEKVAVTVEEFVYRSPLPPRWVEEIVAMRRKMETRSHIRAADFIDLKLGPGGMVDIEFILQLIQLHGRRPRPGSPGVLALLSQGDLSPLRTEESRELLHTYTWHRRLETQMRLTLDEGGSILPEGEKLETLARCFDRSSGESLRRHATTAMQRTRELFLEIAKRISTSPDPDA